MPKKLTYDEVKTYIEEKSKGECKLVTDTYINCETKMEFICGCGNHFTQTFKYLKAKNNFKCNDCINKELSNRFRKDFKEVIKYIESKKCEYISGEYINNSSPLTIKCKCGNVFVKSFSHFFGGQYRCPKCGHESSKKKRKKYDIKIAREILHKKGYTLLSTQYISCDKPLDCLCPKGHEVKIKLSSFMNNNAGCKTCANDNLKGEKHWNYKGGESEVIDFFRKHIKQWKKDALHAYGYKCILTNSQKDIVVHHLKSFSDIIKESCKELQLPLNRKIKDYTEEDFKKLNELILLKHGVSIGIPLQRKIHNKFHAIYGKGGNTKEQFLEFTKKYYPEKYDIICEMLHCISR